MSFLDLLLNEEPKKKSTATAANTPVNVREANGGTLQVYHPRYFHEIQEIINGFKENRSALVYVEQLRDVEAQRVVDMLCGAIYALEGGVYKIDKDIFMFNLDGVTLKK